MIHTFLSNLDPKIKLFIAIVLLLISAVSYGQNIEVSMYIGLVGLVVLLIAIVQLFKRKFSG